VKKLFILIVIVLTQACTPANEMNLAKAQWLCKNDGYLHKFRGELEHPVECTSGRKFSRTELKAVIMPVDFANEQGLGK